MVEEGFVDVEGGRVAFRLLPGGDGTPLLLVHGGPGMAWDYLEPLERLSADRPVVLYDQLGCGRSDRPDDPSLWRVDRFVDEVRRVREALGLDRAFLLGHSWGGCLATAYARTDPPGLAGLVLASPLLSTDRWLADAAALRSQLPRDVRAVLDRHEAGGSTDCPEYVAAAVVFYKRHLCRVDPWPDALERTWTNMGLDVYLAMWGPTEFHATGSLRGYDLTPQLPRISVPTLLTCGRHDEARPETVASFRDLIPGAAMVVFEESSHTPHLEEPERYLDVVAAFLRDVDVP
ncbi:MAG TPA: proline iminopeptidase-family hydrolase [Actinomycetota bacterium]|nr:proline iminopeptidase-family hydrolase [Actinomycetota bacterium]